MTKAIAKKPAQPNPEIDKALKALMKRIEPKADGTFNVPEDVAVKIIQSAIAWEKVKHNIQDQSTGYNPENL